LTEGIGGSTTDDEGTSDGSDDDTGDNTGSDSSDGTNGESANSGALNVAAFVVGDVTSGDGTVVGGGTDDVEDKASSLSIAVSLVADIDLRADDGGVDAGVGTGEGRVAAQVGGASVVVLAEVGGEVRVDAADGGVAGVGGTGLTIVTVGFGLGDPLTEVVEGVRVNFLTSVDGTEVAVIAIGVDQANRLRRAQVGEDDLAGGGITDVAGALVAGRDGLVLNGATGQGIAIVNLAHVGTSAVGPGGVSAIGEIDISGVNANVDGTSVEVVADGVGGGGALGEPGAEVGVVDEAGGGVASVAGAHGGRRDGLEGHAASGDRVAGVGVAEIGSGAVDGIDLTVVVVRIDRGDDTGVFGASVVVVAISVYQALRRAQVGVDDFSVGGVTLVIGAHGVGLDGVGGGSTSSGARVGGTVASVGVALVGGIVARTGRLGNAGTAGADLGDGVAEVSGVAAIGSDATAARAETAATSAGDVIGALLTSQRNQLIDK
jgi:hypothetical protein